MLIHSSFGIMLRKIWPKESENTRLENVCSLEYTSSKDVLYTTHYLKCSPETFHLLSLFFSGINIFIILISKVINLQTNGNILMEMQ